MPILFPEYKRYFLDNALQWSVIDTVSVRKDAFHYAKVFSYIL